MRKLKLSLPTKFAPLLRKRLRKRFKVLYGGRGGAKSHSVAEALLIEGMESPVRILCCREVQVSIKQSVHQLLEDKIKALGLSGFYQVLDQEIRGANGTLIVFRGLSNETADSLKSIEAIDICWVEEAQTITERSLRVLIPTIIRKTGAEIWFTFNPVLESDPVYKMFVTNKHPRAWVQKVGLFDNPYVSEDMLEECEYDYMMDPTMAAHVWGGQTAPAVEGAIYLNELSHLRARGGVVPIPLDPVALTSVSFDLGIGDHTSLVIGQNVGFERRILRAYENNDKPISHYIDWLKNDLGWRIDRIILPHDGNSRSLQTGVSIKAQLQTAFPNTEIIVVGRDSEGVQLGLEEQISAVRDRFGSLWIDPKAELLLEALKCYKRRYDKRLQAFCEPLHDKYSDMADSFRYFMIAEPPRRAKAKSLKPARVTTIH